MNNQSNSLGGFGAQHMASQAQHNAQLSQHLAQQSYQTVASIMDQLGPATVKVAAPTNPLKGWWSETGSRATPQTDLMVLRCYLINQGIKYDVALTMPSDYLRELVKAFRKLETGDIDTELVYGMMDDGE